MNNQLLAALGAVLVALVPLVRAWVQANITPERLRNIESIGRVAVQAAERLGADTGATSTQKLDFAATVVAAGAKRLGLKLSQDEVLAFVHSSLLDLQQVQAYANASNTLP